MLPVFVRVKDAVDQIDAGSTYMFDKYEKKP
jgi:hypothetical protein